MPDASEDPVSIDGRCPRCGTTLPTDAGVSCPDCGFDLLERPAGIEVSPDQLLAEVALYGPDTPFEAEHSAVVTSTSGLLKTEPGQDAVAAPEVAEQSRVAIVAVTIAVTVVLLLLALVVGTLSGR